MKKKLAGALLFVFIFASLGIPDVKEGEAEYTFARLAFNMQIRRAGFYNAEGQVPWEHDYPFAEDLFLTMLKEATGVRTSSEAYKIVRLDSPDVFKYPFLYISEPGF